MTRARLGLLVIALLALAQGVLGVLRALEWVRVGTDLFGRGLVLLPLFGAMAIVRGTLVAATALLYVLFAWGALAREDWAWSLGLTAALLNGLLVLSAVVTTEALGGALIWAVVPAVLLVYLLAPAGRRALGR